MPKNSFVIHPADWPVIDATDFVYFDVGGMVDSGSINNGLAVSLLAFIVAATVMCSSIWDADEVIGFGVSRGNNTL